METLTANQDELTYHERDMQARIDLETRFAEIVSGSMRTPFELQFIGTDLVGEDGRSLTEVTDKAIVAAERIAQEDPSMGFEPPRRKIESEEVQEAIEMAKGNRPNSMIIPSDHPYALMDAKEDVGGYNVTRKQTMLRVLMLQPNGNILMVSQSLDGSNRQALEAIYKNFGLEPKAGELLGQRIQVDLNPYEQENLVDNLTGIYDLSLVEQFGGEWYAGRRPADIRNTYDFVRKQHDLIEMCVALQREGNLSRDMLYNVAATMQKRFDQGSDLLEAPPIQDTDADEPEVVKQARLIIEIEGAGNSARRLGVTFSGCGETLRADGTDDSTESKLEQAGYGSKSTSEDCEYISKKCPVCDAKNVKTTVKRTPDGKKHVSGSCGCSKLYNRDGSDAGAAVSFAYTKPEGKSKEKNVSEFFATGIIKGPEISVDN